jgi:hypothetical protein
MSDLADIIFGTTPKTTTTTNSLMTQQQQATLAQVIQDLMSKGKTTASSAYTPYTSSLTAGTTQGTQLSLKALEQQVINEATGGAGSMSGTAQELSKLIASGGSPVDINDVFTKSVQQPMMKTFTDTVLPSLQGTFSGSAAFGSDKLKQQEILTNNLMNTLTASRSDMAYKSQSDAANRMMTALGLMPQVASTYTGTMTAGATAQDLTRQVNQSDLTAQYNEFLRGQQSNSADVNQLMSALGLSAIQPVTTVTPGSTGLVGGAANTATAMIMNSLLKGGTGSTGLMGGVGDYLSSLFGGGSGGLSVESLMGGSSDLFGFGGGIGDALGIGDILGIGGSGDFISTALDLGGLFGF